MWFSNGNEEYQYLQNFCDNHSSNEMSTKNQENTIPKKSRGGRKPEKDDQLTIAEQQKRAVRRESNKLAAARCRQRKIEQMKNLEQQCDKAETENSLLKATLTKLLKNANDLQKRVKQHQSNGCKLPVDHRPKYDPDPFTGIDWVAMKEAMMPVPAEEEDDNVEVKTESMSEMAPIAMSTSQPVNLDSISKVASNTDSAVSSSNCGSYFASQSQYSSTSVPSMQQQAIKPPVQIGQDDEIILDRVVAPPGGSYHAPTSKHVNSELFQMLTGSQMSTAPSVDNSSNYSSRDSTDTDSNCAISSYFDSFNPHQTPPQIDCSINDAMQAAMEALKSESKQYEMSLDPCWEATATLMDLPTSTATTTNQNVPNAMSYLECSAPVSKPAVFEPATSSSHNAQTLTSVAKPADWATKATTLTESSSQSNVTIPSPFKFGSFFTNLMSGGSSSSASTATSHNQKRPATLQFSSGRKKFKPENGRECFGTVTTPTDCKPLETPSPFRMLQEYGF